MPDTHLPSALPPALPPAKFLDPLRTAAGDPRAQVQMRRLDTLWFNTGTLCNVTCGHCYIESSPRNDRLAYLTAAEVAGFLDEIDRDRLGTRTIGFTGGEPFMNRDLRPMLEDVLGRGLDALVLTNAMQPLLQARTWLPALLRFGGKLTIRVSLDHHSAAVHEAERGAGTWAPTIAGLRWLAETGFAVHVAGRRFTNETEAALRAGYGALFAGLGLALDAADPVALTIFPEMDATAEVPEITEACWGILGRTPDSVMCASARMVVKRKGAARPAVLACTLLPYDPRFELGASLGESFVAVALNHPHCARFCVLGGGACSR
ncbi:MAG: radical SAM protein [Proteobacteria bacterium]|nr:radical SAM protein [Pseudomonadota bacterium]